MRSKLQRGLEGPPEQVAAVLRERIYGGIACLSTLLVLLLDDDDPAPWTALVSVAVATGGLWAASLFADVVSHLAALGHGPGRAGLTGMLRASGQILEATYVPLLLLALAGFGVLAPRTALQLGVWVSVVTLGLFALLAARRVDVPWWKRLLVVVTLLALGAFVVLVKTLAH